MTDKNGIIKARLKVSPKQEIFINPLVENNEKIINLAIGIEEPESALAETLYSSDKMLSIYNGLRKKVKK